MLTKSAVAQELSVRFLCLVCLCALMLTLGSCVKQAYPSQAKTAMTTNRVDTAGISLVNLNTAPASELEKLPGIGPGLAKRIIEHREQYGSFRRTEHLIMVRGLSHKKFLAMRSLVTVE